jgi:hypothetical protein
MSIRSSSGLEIPLTQRVPERATIDAEQVQLFSLSPR